MKIQKLTKATLLGSLVATLSCLSTALLAAELNSNSKPATDPGWTYVPPAPNTLAALGVPAQSVQANITSTSAVPRLQFVLHWNATPSDLDSHLLTPVINNNTYHVYYSNRGSSSSVPFAWLNQDVTSGYGPETITIEQSFPGVYHYFVYQFSSGGDFGVSGAYVQVLADGVLQQTINIPTTGTGRYWDVGLVDGSTGTFYLINQLTTVQPTNSLSTRIMSPRHSGSILVGDTLRFSGRYTGIMDVAATNVVWDFGDGRTVSGENPGLVSFQTNGVKNVTFSFVSDGILTNFVQDTRTITVVTNTGSAPDLLALTWLGSTNLAIGQSVPVSYVVTNRGNAAVTNVTWTDAIYLSVDSVLDSDDYLLTSGSVNRVLQPGECYTNTLNVPLPTLGEGAYKLIVSVDDNWQILEQHRLNNELTKTVGAVIPRLTNDVVRSAVFANDNASHYYQMDVPAGQTLTFSLNKTNNDGISELYVRYGSLPTRSAYDYRAGTGAAANQSVLIPSTTAGTLYVLAYGADIGTSGRYTLLPHLAPIILTSIGANQLCTTQTMTFALSGAGFAAGDIVSLLDTNGIAFATTNILVDSVAHLTVTFEANSVPPGLYSVQVSGNGGSATLTNVLTLLSTGLPHFIVNLVSPGVVGYHMPATFYVVYTNSGTASMPAPLVVFTMTQNDLQYGFLTLDSRKAGQSFWTPNEQPGFSHSIQFLASGAMPGLLQPGESARIAIYYAGWKQDTSRYGTGLYGWDSSRHPMTFSLNTIAADNTMPIDWGTLGQQVRPSGMTDAAWGMVLTNLENQIGTTWGGYVAALDHNATSLSQLGVSDLTIANLFALALRQAEGLGIVGISGHIVNAVTLQPITNTVVNDLSADFTSVASTTTDANGFFALTGLNNGRQNLSLTGYLITSNSTVTITNGMNVTGVQVQAVEAGHITGHVKTAADGHVLTNVLVECVGQTNNRTFQVWSDVGGFFSFATLPADSYTLSCAPAGFISGSITGIVVALGQSYPGNDFNLVAGATISGVAHSQADGSILANATIQIQGLNSGRTFTATTGADGSYQITGLPADTYTLQCLFNGQVCQTISGIVISAGQIINGENVTVNGTTLSGTVVASATGSLIAGAQVMLFSNQTVVAATTTGTNGQYMLPGIPAGTYDLAASATNYAPSYLTNQPISGVATQIVVHLGLPAKISGTITLNGQSASNVFVLAHIQGNTNFSLVNAITGSDGRFSLENLGPGTYDLAFIDPDHGVDTQTNGVTITPGQQLDIGVIALPQPSGTPHNVQRPHAAILFNPSLTSLAVASWPLPLSLTCPGWVPPGHPALPTNANSLVVQAALLWDRDYLSSKWIPASYVWFGWQTCKIWADFINSTQEAPKPIRNFTDGSEIVEGRGLAKGFRNSDNTVENISEIENTANRRILNQYTAAAAADPSFSLQLDIKDILPDNPGQLLYTPPGGYGWNFNHPFEIPGNIAGGAGESDLYPDSRWVTGTVFLHRTGDNLLVTYNLELSVLDTFDFVPGDLGAGIEQAATRAFAFLERYDQAYDITFTVTCNFQPVTFPFPLPTNAIPQPPCNDCSSNSVTVPGPQDPNAKIGPVGYGPQGYVAVDSDLPYVIYFENSTNAAAPAQQVFVWDYLSTNLDWSTFELGGIGFGSQYVPIPPFSDYFETNVIVTYNGVDIEVPIQAGLDFASGKVFANFGSLDPGTHLPPAVNIGFLPPDDGTGIGMGYVSFAISPKPHLHSGTQITNIAYIQFDEEPVIPTDLVDDHNPALGIDTNKVCLITIDAGSPTSSVLPLPTVVSNLQFTVSWSGTDDTNGSGIADYIIYYSTNGTTFNVWLANTTNTSATFTGYPGMTNYFYSIAEDNVGYVENKATLVEAQTFVSASATASSANVLSETLNTNMDRQTGLFYQQVVVANLGASTITGLRFTATNLPAIALTNPVILMSAAGTNGNGAPFLDYTGTLAPNSTNTFTLSYYSKFLKAPVGVGVLVEVVSVVAPTNSTGTTFAISKLYTRADGKMAFQLSTLSGRTYVIQYSSDLMTWKQAQTHINGNGSVLVWVDAGPPDTEVNTASSRYYRVVLLPQ